jgi:hypothetical protein
MAAFTDEAVALAKRLVTWAVRKEIQSLALHISCTRTPQSVYITLQYIALHMQQYEQFPPVQPTNFAPYYEWEDL